MKKELKRVSVAQRQWRDMQRKIHLRPTIIVQQEPLFQSIYEQRPVTPKKKKKKKQKKIDEENKENETAQYEEELKKLENKDDSLADFSLLIFKGNVRQKVVDFHRGITVPHEDQPLLKETNKKEESVIEMEASSSSSSCSSSAEEEDEQQEEPYEVVRKTLIEAEKRADETKQFNESYHPIFTPNKTVFSFTPIRQQHRQSLANMSVIDFNPNFVSTPLPRVNDSPIVATKESRAADDSITEVMEQEKSMKKKRMTGEAQKKLQPQEHQLRRETRMSTVSKKTDSIVSLLEDVSIDDLANTIGVSGLTGISQRIESRPGTAMIIHLENPMIIPFYIADMTMGLDSSDMQQLLHVVGQKEPINWTDLPKTMFMATRVKKLGEGSYGEVFATTMEKKPIALKVIPFEADQESRLFDGLVNGGEMPTAGMLLPEVVVAQQLSRLDDPQADNSTPNFIKVASISIVRGLYPNGLLKAWDVFATKKESLNDRPSLYSSERQCFAAFAFENGGVDLESFVFKSEQEIRSVLIQLILSFIVAESCLEFEHRDLHLGNVLIARNKSKLNYKIGGTGMSVTSHGVKVAIIDYTLSRIKRDGATVFQDLTCQDIFDGTGDEQFDLYRRMRDNNGNDWSAFHSCTNIWWIRYLGLKMIEPPICPKGILTRPKKQTLKKLITQLGDYPSCRMSFADRSFYEQFYDGYICYDVNNL